MYTLKIKESYTLAEFTFEDWTMLCNFLGYAMEADKEHKYEYVVSAIKKEGEVDGI